MRFTPFPNGPFDCKLGGGFLPPQGSFDSKQHGIFPAFPIILVVSFTVIATLSENPAKSETFSELHVKSHDQLNHLRGAKGREVMKAPLT